MTTEYEPPLAMAWRESVQTALERGESVFDLVAPYAFATLMERVYETVRRGELSEQAAEEYCEWAAAYFLEVYSARLDLPPVGGFPGRIPKGRDAT